MSARASGALADIVDEADRPAEYASSSARGRHSGPQASGDDRRGVEDHSNERGRRPSLVVDCTGEPRPGILETGGGRECGGVRVTLKNYNSLTRLVTENRYYAG